MDELVTFVTKTLDLDEESSTNIPIYVAVLKEKGVRKPSDVRDDLLPRERLFSTIPEVFVNMLYNARKAQPAERQTPIVVTAPTPRAFVLDWDDIGRKTVLEKEFVSEQTIRAVIRDAVAQLHQKIGFVNPGARAKRELAEQLVEKYPRHFLNKIGNGNTRSYTTTYSRIEKHSEYLVLRYQSARGKKEKKRRSHEDYATVRFAPPLSTDENVRAEWKALKKSLRELHENERASTWNWNYISNSMMQIYNDLRHDINDKSPTIEKLLKKWPFLFYPKIMMEHFNYLMDKSAEAELLQFVATDVPTLLTYFTTFSPKHVASAEIHCKMETAIRKDAESTIHAPLLAALHMICEFLNPGKFPKIYRQVKVAESKNEELEALQDLPNTPLIFALGADHWASSVFCVMIEKKVVTRLETFQEALTYFFAAFYVLNMQYPADLGETLEYIERCIMHIALDKEPESKKKAKPGKSTKLQNLTSHIKEYEALRAEWLRSATEIST